MSVTFSTDATVSTFVTREACLCAQFAPGWPASHDGDLARHAEPSCLLCEGTGLEVVQSSDEPALNVANLNALALLDLLGLGSDCYGECHISDMQRAIVGAKNRFARRAPALAREEQVGRRFVSAGLSLERLDECLERMQALVSYGRERGARVVRWE